MNEKLISFIIPCYNGELYIERIIDSIFSNNECNFEVIVVNDGSKDRSLLILNGLSLKYSKLKVIDQVNQGASSARNNGLRLAQGKYVCFLDVDDQVLIHNYEALVKCIDKDDLYLFNVLKSAEDKIYPYIQQTNPYKNKSQLLSDGQYFNAPWGKLIRRSLLIKNNISFNTSLKIAEDLPWSIQVLESASKIKTIDLDFYIYKTDNAASTTNSINANKFDSMWNTLVYTVEFCDNNKYSDVAYSLCAYQYMMNCSYTASSYDKYKIYYKKYNYLLKFHDYKRVKTVYRLNRIIGIRGCSILLNKYLYRGGH